MMVMVTVMVMISDTNVWVVITFQMVRSKELSMQTKR